MVLPHGERGPLEITRRFNTLGASAERVLADRGSATDEAARKALPESGGGGVQSWPDYENLAVDATNGGSCLPDIAEELAGQVILRRPFPGTDFLQVGNPELLPMVTRTHDSDTMPQLVGPLRSRCRFESEWLTTLPHRRLPTESSSSQSLKGFRAGRRPTISGRRARRTGDRRRLSVARRRLEMVDFLKIPRSFGTLLTEFRNNSSWAHRDDGVAPARQVLDMVRLRFGPGRLTSKDYYRMRVYRRSLSLDEKRQFVSRSGVYTLKKYLDLARAVRQRTKKSIPAQACEIVELLAANGELGASSYYDYGLFEIAYFERTEERVY